MHAAEPAAPRLQIDPGVLRTPGSVPEEGIGSDDLESDFPAIPLESKEIRVMNPDPEFDEKLVELLEQQYGVKPIPVTVSWADIPVRLSTMVMSDDAPDLVVNPQRFGGLPELYR